MLVILISGFSSLRLIGCCVDNNFLLLGLLSIKLNVRWTQSLNHLAAEIRGKWDGEDLLLSGVRCCFNSREEVVRFFLRSAGPDWPRSVAQRPARARSGGEKSSARWGWALCAVL